MEHDFSLFTVMAKGGWTIIFLIGMSIVVFGVLFDRWRAFKKAYQSWERTFIDLGSYIKGKGGSEAIEACERNGSFLACVVKAGLVAKSQKIDPVEAMERETKAQILRLETHLPLLATIGSTAPFVGLFGTVLGIIRAFRDLALANAGGAAVVSQGIAEALIATATGLFVAITAVFISNHFQSRLDIMAQEAEIAISQVKENL